jgi:hypothetical protein
MYALRGVVVVDLGSEEFEDALGGFGRRGREKHGGGRGGDDFRSGHEASY